MQDNTNALLLLEQARGKIESNIFTRFFTRPVLVVAEVAAYVMIPVSLLIALGLWETVAETTDAVIKNSTCIRWENNTGTVSEAMDDLVILTLIIAILFPLLMLLIARLITASRRRLGVFRDVEVFVEEAMEELRKI